MAQETASVAPQDLNKKNEVKINALTLLAAKWIDVSYERLINQESSFGISIALNTDVDIDFDFDGIDLKYSLTPYYRRYFSEKFARGFFVEGFGMLFSEKNGDYNYLNNTYEDSTQTGFALGVSVGGKFVSKKGFTTEILLGFGRNLTSSTTSEAIARLGISLGYRF
jgi:hypothetical protein